MPRLAKPIDLETSRITEKLVFVSASVLLDVVAVGSRVQPPVDATDVVARHVAAVLGEVDRRAEVRRAVQPVDEAVDDRPRQQIQVADPREHLRVDEPGAGDGAPLAISLEETWRSEEVRK